MLRESGHDLRPHLAARRRRQSLGSHRQERARAARRRRAHATAQHDDSGVVGEQRRVRRGLTLRARQTQDWHDAAQERVDLNQLLRFRPDLAAHVDAHGVEARRADDRARALERDLLAVGCDEHSALHTPLDRFDGARSLRARHPLRKSTRHNLSADPRHGSGPRVHPVQRRPERLSREQRALEERRVARDAQSAAARRRAVLQKLSEF